jgi:hypothetical protein
LPMPYSQVQKSRVDQDNTFKAAKVPFNQAA